ncbi:MAG: T9SS C-terminal target domain-containing protein [Porphyromonadaceae bacterium]|nr:MAG: T9SS C-terminal target domain-containing protein [Porphyromonadaceae bacterium]
MKRLLILALICLTGIASIGQTHLLKGNGQVFWEEHFDWGNPADAKGWTAPAGWVIEDLSADDTGFVWAWTRDSMQGPFAHRDGGYILNSTTRENGFLAIDLDNLNAFKNYTDMLYVNSSITLPVMNFSTHPSVILSLEQMFKYFNSPRMVIEVTNDKGKHWAEFDLKMGTARGVNVMNLPNNQVAHFTANISEVAAGQPEVTIKLTWSGSILYFWMLDDLTFSEGWDYDLKMNHWQAQLIDNNPDASAGFLYMMPKTQILPIGLFEASVINYGEIEQTNIRFQAEILKNGASQFNESSNSLSYSYFGDPADTLFINKTYTPVDYGHYELVFGMKSDQVDQNPENNRKSYFFHVTDSVYSRTPDESEANESPWRDYYQYTHEGDLMGTEYDPISDCEASSISVYISKANVGADFRFVLLEITPAAENQVEMIELLTTDMVTVDSTLLKQGWVTLPLATDGQGELMKAGKRYLAAVEFWTYITADNLINRKNTFWIGSTKNYPGSYDKQWGYESYNSEWKNGSSFNKMIRLNINNHENRVDGIPQYGLENSLGQNFPNPFSAETQISYQLGKEAPVTIEIKDITGKVVQITEEGTKPAGMHSVTIRNTDLDAGIYFYTLKAGKFSITKRMVVSK